MKPQTQSPCAAIPAHSTAARRMLPARLKQLTLTAAAALALGCLAANAQNLLVNGSFETGDLSGWTAINNIPGGPYNAPPVVAHFIEGASDGSFSAVFNIGETQPIAALEQTFATVLGAQYTLSFDYGTFTRGGGPFPQSLIVEVSNSSLTPQVATSVQSVYLASPIFTTFTYTFTATATSSTLRFSDFPANVTYSEDGILDNVSVVTAAPPADTTPPVITSLASSSTTLWPPNHKLVPITLSASASDNVGVTSLKIISVTSNEPDNGLGDGDTAGDIVITGDLTLNLRAERSGKGNGRVYTITVEARDAAGNTSTKTVTVSVPKSQGK